MSSLVVGADEVGRGCLAGPLVVAAVAWIDVSPNWLFDSKQLSPKGRRLAFGRICQESLATSICFLSPQTIDQKSLGFALRDGFNRTIADVLGKLQQSPDEIIIDGPVNYYNQPFRTRAVVKADTKFQAVMAASILAKVVRDCFMSKIIAYQYPGYRFDHHKGYGSQQHLLAIEELGAIPAVHRFSFKPIKS